MALYNLYAGMGGGFGGATFQLQDEFDTHDAAIDYARVLAVEDYEGYAGCHGILSWDEVKDELCDENCSDQDVDDLYNEEIEGWIEYWAVDAEHDPDWDYDEGVSYK